jgi:hypothetical protein
MPESTDSVTGKTSEIRSVWFNGFTWCVASSPDEATALVNASGVGDDPDERDPWEAVPADKPLTMRCDTMQPITKTAAEWAATETGVLGHADW